MEQGIQINGNTAAYYEPLLASGLSEIPVYGSGAKWIKNANCPNNYTLENNELKIGKDWLHDKMLYRIFGYTQEILYGEHKGKIEATIPALQDEDDEDMGDCEIIGYFESVASAMACIIERNHPDYGIWT